MQKVQGQKPALEETRNSKVTVLAFIYFVKDQDFIRLFFRISLVRTKHLTDLLPKILLC
jgi:hypothetical protein